MAVLHPEPVGPAALKDSAQAQKVLSVCHSPSTNRLLLLHEEPGVALHGPITDQYLVSVNRQQRIGPAQQATTWKVGHTDAV